MITLFHMSLHLSLADIHNLHHMFHLFLHHPLVDIHDLDHLITLLDHLFLYPPLADIHDVDHIVKVENINIMHKLRSSSKDFNDQCVHIRILLPWHGRPLAK